MDGKCENCKFCCDLTLFARKVETIGGIGYVSGWKVGMSRVRFSKSYGCIALLADSGTVHETILYDTCELFQPKEKENKDNGEK